MNDDLAEAYELISSFKNGELTPGSIITAKQLVLLRALCKDLLPNILFDKEDIPETVVRLAEADTFWNKRTAATADDFYALTERGDVEGAQRHRQEFLATCPSEWYRTIVKNL